VFGLYKAPTRPPRRQAKTQESGAKSAKSNTRNAKNKRSPQPAKPREKGAFPVETPRLYLGNLSYEANESDLEELFKGVGSVRNVEIIYNRHTHRSKGYGFLTMLSVEEAKRAVEVLHDQPFMGRNLIVNGAKAKPTEDSRPPRTERSEESSEAVAAE